MRRVIYILVLALIVFSACEKQNGGSDTEKRGITEIGLDETVPSEKVTETKAYEKSLYATTQQETTFLVVLYSDSGNPVCMKYLYCTTNRDTVTLDGCNAIISEWSTSEGLFSLDDTYPSSLQAFSGTIKLENDTLVLLSDDKELVLEKGVTPPWSSIPFSAMEAEVAGYPFGVYLYDDLIGCLGDEVAREPYTMYETDQLAKVEYRSMIIDGFLGSDGSLISVKGFKVIDGEIETVRGIMVGDALDSIISRFPGSQTQNERYIHEVYGDIKMLYGQPEHMQNYGYVLYENDEPSKIIYVSGESRITFELNDMQRTISIEYSW